MSRVTKLSLDVLQEKSKTTPVFAPGLANLTQTGAVAKILDPNVSLAEQLSGLLAGLSDTQDTRDRLGKERQGRPKAADIAERVYALARASV
jgi:malonate decarboxylase gamma subunit